MLPLRSLVEERRDEIKAIAARHRGRAIAVFGSVARGQEGPDSGLDFLVDFEADSSLFDLVRLQADLQDLLSRPVDVVSLGGSLGMRTCARTRSGCEPQRREAARRHPRHVQDGGLAGEAWSDRRSRPMTCSGWRWSARSGSLAKRQRRSATAPARCFRRWHGRSCARSASCSLTPTTAWISINPGRSLWMISRRSPCGGCPQGHAVQGEPGEQVGVRRSPCWMCPLRARGASRTRCGALAQDPSPSRTRRRAGPGDGPAPRRRATVSGGVGCRRSRRAP